MGRPLAVEKRWQASTMGAAEMGDLVAALRAVGYAPKRLPGVARSVAAQGFTSRVPVSVAKRILAAAERRTGDHLIGLHAGTAAQPGDALVHLIIAAARLRDALAYIERFSRLLADALRARVEVGDTTAKLVYEFDDPMFPETHHLASYLMIVAAGVLRRAVGPSFRLHSVHFRHREQPGERAESQHLFGCPVEFRQPDDALVLYAADLSVKPQVANPLVAEQLEKFVAALTAQATPPSGFRDRVTHAVRAGLADGIRIDRATVAQRLQMSEATLLRRLADEGTTFKAVREAIVWEVVDALLSNPSAKLEAVALSVGFVDAAAFAKAVRRRAGCSPTRYRQRLTARVVRALR